MLPACADELIRETLQTLARLTTTPFFELRQLHVECPAAGTPVGVPAMTGTARVRVNLLHLPKHISHESLLEWFKFS